MKRITSQRGRARSATKAATSAVDVLVFGAHPDDIEFGCGAIVARETQNGRKVHFVVCSRGEAASNGTPRERTQEAQRAAELLGATIEFADLGGDAHFDVTSANAITLAAIIRRTKPTLVLVTSAVENQHPDHVKLGRMVRDATRLARYGGLKELRGVQAHAIGQLFFYAVTPEAEPTDLGRVLVDVSDAGIVKSWTAAMEAHASQMKTRNYVELQLTRARLNGLRAGVEYALPLFAADAVVVNSLAALDRAARRF